MRDAIVGEGARVQREDGRHLLVIGRVDVLVDRVAGQLDLFQHERHLTPGEHVLLRRRTKRTRRGIKRPSRPDLSFATCDDGRPLDGNTRHRYITRYITAWRDGASGGRGAFASTAYGRMFLRERLYGAGGAGERAFVTFAAVRVFQSANRAVRVVRVVPPASLGDFYIYTRGYDAEQQGPRGVEDEKERRKSTTFFFRRAHLVTSRASYEKRTTKQLADSPD